jgi:DNA-binding response OmpR family regulator
MLPGIELLGELRRQHRNRTLPVAVLSNLDSEEPALDRGWKRGVIGCLLKTQTVPRTLACHIRSWLPRGQAPHRSVVTPGAQS